MTDERDELAAEVIKRVNELGEKYLGARLEKLEAAVRVYDTLGVELVAQLKALKIRVDELEAGRISDIVGPS